MSLVKLSNQHNNCPDFSVKLNIFHMAIRILVTVFHSTTASGDKCNDHKR